MLIFIFTKHLSAKALTTRLNLSVCAVFCLGNVYLESWTIYLPMEQLISIFDKVQLFAGLYSAIIYREITLNLEVSQKWQMAGAVPFFLKTLLKQMQPDILHHAKKFK